MVGLYYENLGFPKEAQNDVNGRLWEFRNFLRIQKSNQKKIFYRFEYRNYLVFGTLSFKEQSAPSGIMISETDLFYADSFFFDENGQQKIPTNQILNEKKQLWVINDDPGTIFARYKKYPQNLIPLTFSPIEYRIEGIKFLSTSVQQEDKVLETLSNTKYILDDENDNLNSRIKVNRNIKKTAELVVDRLPRQHRKTFWIQENTKNIERKINALNHLIERPQEHHLPLLNLVRTRGLFQWKDVLPLREPKSFFVLTDSTKDGIKEQREFVKKVLSTPDFAILEGPPGSGKTTVLLEIIAQLISDKKSVLMVGSTHVAVDNILERLKTYRHNDGSGEKTLLDACSILPVRIGRSDDVSDDVKEFLLENLADAQISRIMKRLEEKSTHSNAQSLLYQCLSQSNEKAKKVIEEVIIDSANLVCGTTFGFLNEKRLIPSNLAKAHFDVLIIDESSKTTFQEFLVPALYAKKWVISGDPRQLSPFIDRDEILTNIKWIPYPKNKKTYPIDNNDKYLMKKVSLFTFIAMKKHFVGKTGKWYNFPILHVTSDLDEMNKAETGYKRQLDAVKSLFGSDPYFQKNYTTDLWISKIETVPKSDDIKGKLKIYGSDILIVQKNLIRDIESYLPLTIIQTTEDLSDSYIENRKAMFRNIFEQKFVRDKTGNWLEKFISKRKWDEEILWRLCELPNIHDHENTEKYQRFSKEIELLLPAFCFSEEINGFDIRKKFLEDLHSIRRITFPSVIELLQNGFEISDFKNSESIALFSGLSYSGNSPEILKKRHDLLKYQHRMHPHISRFSRDYIYNKKALCDAKDIEKKREWGYPVYKDSHFVWKSVNPSVKDLGDLKKNQNAAEIREMINEFEKFLKWAENNPKIHQTDKYWTVAFLSFYSGQVNKIREALKPYSHLEGSYSEFELSEKNTSVLIFTVDGFQGHEADMVFLSFVRSYKGTKKVGFAVDPRRLNVALTRARFQLVIFGDHNFFIGQNESPLLRKLAETSERTSQAYNVVK